MNKTVIKKFAIDARRKLIASVTDKAGMLGITEKGCSGPISQGADFKVYKTAADTEVTLNRKQCEQRDKLEAQINARGFKAIVEEVAYTWFNRICAIRFMEVNDYLPTRVRVLSSEKDGKTEPDIVTQAPDVDLDLTAEDKEYIIELKLKSDSKSQDEIFRFLFIKQCNKLHEVLPELFEKTSDYTELLLDISYTNKDEIIFLLVSDKDGIPEDDFSVSAIDENGNNTGQVEIIGWLYQYYNTELKDDTFAKLKKNVKISKDRIPAATQLFTPDWIVRYMVENSLGRLWLEGHPNPDMQKDWRYYLDEAVQEQNVQNQINKMKEEYKTISPEDIKLIDPSMGSGHILVYAFDVLMKIYESLGYSQRDAAKSIVENNIFGLDIDDRAYQLSYFAIMMKARQYNRRILSEQIKCNVFSIQESDSINREHLEYLGANIDPIKRKEALKQIIYVLDLFEEAKEYGSILHVNNCDWSLLNEFISTSREDSQITFTSLGLYETKEKLKILLNIAQVMNRKYDVVVTNPPYMATSNMSTKLLKYIKDYYTKNRTDLFAIFIQKSIEMTKTNGFIGMITQHSWMFLSSYEELRKTIISYNIDNMAHLGSRAFDEIGGEVVQTTSWIMSKRHIENFCAKYLKLTDGKSENEKKNAFFNNRYLYKTSTNNFVKLPNYPIAYWISKNMINLFKNKPLGEVCNVKHGMTTADNNRFIRQWSEVSFDKIGFAFSTTDEATESRKKWFPYNKGGEYRKWYGNNTYVVNYENDGEEIKEYTSHLPQGTWVRVMSREFYFNESLTWTLISSNSFGIRYSPQGAIFDVGGSSLFSNINLKYILGFLTSKVAYEILMILNPTINFSNGVIAKIPIIFNDSIKNEIEKLVDRNIEICKQDWDSFENSWEFKKHPLISKGIYLISDAYKKWENNQKQLFLELKRNEEIINSKFSEICNVPEIDYKVSDIEISIRKADERRETISLISYAVGNLFGRYSIGTEGVVYAGGEWDTSKYSRFIPDADNIIPITDEEYFEDDIIGLFCKWLKQVYGVETLEKNLDYIAKVLGNKGDSSREVIRNYFLKDFFIDHSKTYQKRPIYWLFDSGKENGFKALIYLHRYNADTVGRVRTDYLHKEQAYVEAALRSAEYTIENSSSASEKSKATKAVSKYTKQLAEMKIYDEAIAHIASQRIELDLDDGVKVNYEKFQEIEVSREGQKSLKIDLLAKIK